MKYKFLTLLVLLVLFSCKKPTNYCWQCEVQKYKDYIYDGMPTQVTILCDKPENFVYRYEQQHTYSDGKGTGNDMYCVKLNTN